MARFFALSLVVLVSLSAVVVWIRLDAPVQAVNVTGQLDRAQSREVGQVVAQTLDGGMLSADLGLLRTELLALSWPREVSIRRVWPAGLEIDISKAMVVATWKDAYLASDGRVVHLPGKQLDLPIFDCALSQPKVAMEIFHRLSEAGSAVGLTIDRLQENSLGEWQLSVGRGVTVMLGAELLVERLRRFAFVYERELKERLDQVAHVDARYANGVAVSWRTDRLDATATVAAK